jgi:hypothetical protein
LQLEFSSVQTWLEFTHAHEFSGVKIVLRMIEARASPFAHIF